MATEREINKGFEYLDAMPRYRRVDANAQLMSHAIHSEDKTITMEVLHQIFNRIKPKLAVNPEYAEAYRVFFERHPEYALECNMAILDAVLIKRSDAVTADNLEELLLPGNPHNVISQLAITAEARQAQFEAREIDRMIGEITGYMLGENGKPKPEYTQRQYNEKVASLRVMPFSDLVARYDTVMIARAQRKAPVEELRTLVKTDAVRQRQALYERYEPVPPTYVPPGKSEGVRWSFDLFRRLPSTEQRRLLDHYGNEALTAACAAKGN
jgi:hypothetical protein